MDKNWLEKLFINEAKPALDRHSGGSGTGGRSPTTLEELLDPNITEVYMPNVTSLHYGAFYGRKQLVNVIVPKARDMSAYAFYNCTNLALTYLPEGLRYIPTYAFYKCTNLALTSLPEGLTSIGEYAFCDCTNLAITSIPKGVTSIGQYAFRGCKSLNSITFKGKPSSINAKALYSLINIKTINVPWAEGEVANAPWGASYATINYNYTGE